MSSRTIRRIKIHPAQVAELLARQGQVEAAQQRLGDAASIIAMGAGISEGELQGIDTDTNEIVVAVDSPELELGLEGK
jgi:hypothetical protein